MNAPIRPEDGGEPSLTHHYITFRDGTAARTIEIADMVFADLDDNGDPIGVEYVSAADFVPFMRDHAGNASDRPKIQEMLGAAA